MEVFQVLLLPVLCEEPALDLPGAPRPAVHTVGIAAPDDHQAGQVCKGRVRFPELPQLLPVLGQLARGQRSGNPRIPLCRMRPAFVEDPFT